MSELMSFEQLMNETAALHDCPFDLERASFDDGARTWTGTFLRPLWDHTSARHRGLALIFGRSWIPVAETRLSIANVESTTVVDDQGIQCYTFNEASHTPDGLQLRFNETMRIELRTSGPIQAMWEEVELKQVRAIYTHVLLLQSGPRIERDTDGNCW